VQVQEIQIVCKDENEFHAFGMKSTSCNTNMFNLVQVHRNTVEQQIQV
jgi:hypothetical protein